MNSEFERSELRAAVKGIRAEWRERLSAAVGDRSKLGKKAGVLLLELDVLDDKIEDCGGEEGLLLMVCAQVASGVTLKEWSTHYGIEYGLVWSWLSESGERLERYYRALRGVAEAEVGETLHIADSSKPERASVDKARVDVRFRRAKFYARDRFGDSEAALGLGLENLAVVLERISQRRLGSREQVVDAEVLPAERVGAAEVEANELPAADDDVI